jgi:acetyltransferase-like isoleucine patch superfamily enzyme
MTMATTDRKVAAVFGRETFTPDPVFELDLADSLRQTHSFDGLKGLLERFRGGDDAFDSMMRRVLFRALCRRVGHNLRINPDVVVKHIETLEFGDSVFIGAQTMIQGRYDGTCKIGSHVWIGPHAYFDARNIVIEDYVGWGPGAKVLGSTHKAEPIDLPIIATDLVIKPVTIGYGADIGMNATILPGVHVGAHSIVGAGAVVTQDVPEYAVVAGVPAKFLYSRKDRTERLELK